MIASLHKKLDNRIMLIELSHGIWPFRWKRIYRGACTVWHDEKTGRRAGTFTESRLADAWDWFKREDNQ